MNIRTLIARAIQEARAEFEAIVVQRLAALMGDDAVATKGKASAPKRPAIAAAPAAGRTRAKSKAVPTKAKPSAKAAPKASSAKKGPAGPVDEVLLRALFKGDPMGKSALMKAGGYLEKDDTRVGLSLIRLRTEGKIIMSGTRRGATYRIAKRGAAAMESAGAHVEPATSHTTIVTAPAAMEKRASRARIAPAVVVVEPAWRPSVIRRRKSK